MDMNEQKNILDPEHQADRFHDRATLEVLPKHGRRDHHCIIMKLEDFARFLL